MNAGQKGQERHTGHTVSYAAHFINAPTSLIYYDILTLLIFYILTQP
jgi:hypothetical protein